MVRLNLTVLKKNIKAIYVAGIKFDASLSAVSIGEFTVCPVCSYLAFIEPITLSIPFGARDAGLQVS